MTQSFPNNVPSPRFSNQSPGTLDDELRSAEQLGIRPIKVGEAGFDDIINKGTVKWAITTELELVVISKFLDVKNEIYHAEIRELRQLKNRLKVIAALADSDKYVLDEELNLACPAG
ncbi:hypothetical protein [Microcoleus sp. S13C4]|uniref:hypothetical protein n=1 Tax=Microcoleus sp. S13C4 TaxID=3055410 RepID=UPI002FD0D9DC